MGNLVRFNLAGKKINNRHVVQKIILNITLEFTQHIWQLFKTRLLTRWKVISFLKTISYSSFLTPFPELLFFFSMVQWCVTLLYYVSYPSLNYNYLYIYFFLFILLYSEGKNCVQFIFCVCHRIQHNALYKNLVSDGKVMEDACQGLDSKFIIIWNKLEESNFTSLSLVFWLTHDFSLRQKLIHLKEASIFGWREICHSLA